MCFVFVFGLALCILFDGVVDVVLFCCMFRFLFLFSFACIFAGCHIRLFMVRLRIKNNQMCCCVRACLLVRFLVCQLFSICQCANLFDLLWARMLDCLID